MRSLILGAAVLAAACSTSAQAPRTQVPTDVVATVGSKRITLAEADEAAMQQPASNYGAIRLSQAIYEARRAAIDDLVANALIDQDAAAEHVDRAALVDREVTSRVAQPTDAEVSSWYDANRARVQGATLEQARSAIRAYLLQDRTNTVRRAYIDRLKAKTAVKVMLEPPRQMVKAGDAPSKGSASAPIEMIEFSDFQCPYCLAAEPTVQKVLQEYGDRIHFIYRNYPIPGHPNARPAAEAAQCANEQGKFWPYHDRLFADPKHLADADLRRTAAELGLDTGKFNACIDSRKYRAVVDTDLDAGDAAGVSGTPAFFINGRMLTGAQPLDAFKRIIDEELDFKKP